MRAWLLLLLLAPGAVQAQATDDLSERDRRAIQALDAEMASRTETIVSAEARLERYLATLPADAKLRSEAEQTRLQQVQSDLDFLQAQQEAFARRRLELVEGTSVASTFARAANYIFFTDFSIGSVAETFSDQELKILGEHPEALNSMIRTALGWQHSVGGAMLMVHFGLAENFDHLRWHMLNPGRTYGWEGRYTNNEERYYSDGQYVYHSQYLVAIEQLMDAPLHEVIELTDREKERIDDLIADPDHESHHWAIWISRKLRL